ncbi:Ig-like domain-containing protein [Streptomyces sp. H10-C2]|uniref:L,D-transpeptidase n=1 Tax=unclassified Streptomyces TaxID=2593676 RepID=UPI0024BA734B|nr:MULTISPECIES: Ig-like domain-containing protein [unclassified Streptomyces]MDJ0341151.1 Ig-like domain-containing protein [Streptomyces sp. PH10-H1]MDJ0369497.1 Ig-like domain-containing protein [Streptomyces sp. H10-C2]
MSHSSRRRTAMRCALLVAPLAVGLTACGSDDGDPLAASPYDATDQVAYSLADGGKVSPSKPLEITTKDDDSRITDVTATDAAGRYVRGELAADGMRWHSTSPLSAGAHYTVRVSTEDADGRPGRKTVGFDTTAADNLLRVSFGPDTGTYGVGQPITAELSAPVEDPAARAKVEQNLKVTASPEAAEGSWYWVNSRTLHYRPSDYWPANARIDVRSTLDGVRVKDSLYGGPARPLSLKIGDRVEAITDSGTHEMTFKRNGAVVRTIPITTGKPGFSTRNGVKIVLGKEQFVRMQSTSIGIAAGSSDAYDLPVYWATRVTWSGEYVHAAPWSVGSQGVDNVSHGCTGMSTENAHWFFDQVRSGDIVQVVNSLGETMTPFDNGFGDWNLNWTQWKKGSALGAKGQTAAVQNKNTAAVPARLRPEA